MTAPPFWMLIGIVGRQKHALRAQGVVPRAVAMEPETFAGVRATGLRHYPDGAEQAFGLAIEEADELAPGRLEVRP